MNQNVTRRRESVRSGRSTTSRHRFQRSPCHIGHTRHRPSDPRITPRTGAGADPDRCRRGRDSLSVAMPCEAFPAPLRSTGLALTAGVATALIGGTAPWTAQILVRVSAVEAAPGVYVAAIGSSALVALWRCLRPPFRTFPRTVPRAWVHGAALSAAGRSASSSRRWLAHVVTDQTAVRILDGWIFTRST
jgi:hypothetical protein